MDVFFFVKLGFFGTVDRGANGLLFLCFIFSCGTSRCGIYILFVRTPLMKYMTNIQPSFVFMNVAAIRVQLANF